MFIKITHLCLLKVTSVGIFFYFLISFRQCTNYHTMINLLVMNSNFLNTYIMINIVKLLTSQNVIKMVCSVSPLVSLDFHNSLNIKINKKNLPYEVRYSYSIKLSLVLLIYTLICYNIQ